MVSSAALMSRSTSTATPPWSTVQRTSFCTLSSADCEQSFRPNVEGHGGRWNPCMPLNGIPQLAQGPL